MDKTNNKVAIDRLRQMIDGLNQEIVRLETEHYEQAESQNPCFLSSKKQKWYYATYTWFKTGTTTASTPDWHKNTSTIELNRLLLSRNIDQYELAALLNLYALHAAIKLVNLKADRSVAIKAEQLRQISERLRVKEESDL